MEYEQVYMHMEGMIRGYFNIVAETLLQSGITQVNADDLRNKIFEARELVAPEFSHIFDAVFADMVDEIDARQQAYRDMLN